ncbi:hypothetical protein NQ317_002459 [Molorchus minor]|uniref:CTL-like protein 2 n=1 Tax=Molorchus minor TaxID=1323400 RepID=A0ABQ9JIZ5_9CUCU|nr:hypothetical protein NQ317_002459 [Molorchus minor]
MCEIESEPPCQPLQYDPQFTGPLKNRSCTDVICLFLFMVFVGCWAGIGIYAYKNGDPSTLLVPKDSAGSRCGIDSHVKNKSYLFFFDLTQCLDPAVPFTGCKTTQVCVSYCPQSNYFTNSDSSKYEGDEEFCSYYDSTDCPSWYLKSTVLFNRCLYNVADRKNSTNPAISKVQGDEIKLMKNLLSPLHYWMSLGVHNALSYFTKKEIAHQPPKRRARAYSSTLPRASGKACWPAREYKPRPYLSHPYSIHMKYANTFCLWTVKYFPYLCIPNSGEINDAILGNISSITNSNITLENIVTSISNIKLLAQAEEIGQNVVEDIVYSRWNILAGVGIALVCCIIYILMLRWIAGPIVWLSIVGVVVAMSFGVYFTTIKYIEFRDAYNSEVYEEVKAQMATKRDLWLAGLIVLCVVLTIILLMLIFLRKRIVLAIALVKEGSK